MEGAFAGAIEVIEFVVCVLGALESCSFEYFLKAGDWYRECDEGFGLVCGSKLGPAKVK